MVGRRGKSRSWLTIGIPAAMLSVVAVVGSLQSTEWRWTGAFLSEVGALTELEPVRALPRTEAVLAMIQAQDYLDAGRPYAAWEVLEEYIDVAGPDGASVNLLAARAAAEWGGWEQVREVLVDRPWVVDASAEALFLLGRAEEELGQHGAAIDAYRRYVSRDGAQDRGVAHARLAGLLGRVGDPLGAAEHFAEAAKEMDRIADWLQVLRVEQLVAASDAAAGEVAKRLVGGSPPVRLRRALAEARDWMLRAETDRALERLEREARILAAEGAHHEATELDLERARILLLDWNRRDEGRALLREIAGDPQRPSAGRLRAADELGNLEGVSVSEEIARAAAYEAGSRPGAAARALRAALDTGVGDSPEQRLRLARLYFDERDYARARAAFQRAAELLDDPELKAYAELHAARALFRSGGGRRARESSLAEFQRVAERYPGTAAAGTALFLLGDEASTTSAGLAYYRRAAQVAHSPDAREALFRVGDRSLKVDDPAGAIRAWEEYVARYPRGEQTAEAAYRAAKLHERAGRRQQASALFETAARAEPTSYYAARAAERLRVNHFEMVLSEPRPWVGLASDPAAATSVLQRLDALAAAGLTAEREAEYQAALRRFENRPFALLVLAEGIRDRNEPVEAIRLGRLLLQKRDGEWDERLLRLVYPFPYRDLIISEAIRAGVDPYLYAGLVRQESTFRPAIRSRVGATGLGQIMPATGRYIARALGMRRYGDHLLEVPEVNLRMGTKYLGDLLNRYGGAADLALAGYNAGPSRADRWRRQFNYGRDTDAFRESIPFAETRAYVMIVLRNAAIYRHLYGGSGGSGPTFAD